VKRRRRTRFLDRRMLGSKALSGATRLMRCVTTVMRWVHCSSYRARPRCGLRSRPAPVSLQEDLDVIPEQGFVPQAEHRGSIGHGSTRLETCFSRSARGVAGGQFYVKCRPLANGALDLNTATGSPDNLMRYREPEPHSPFCRKKGIK
jgi:hypothetical protein